MHKKVIAQKCDINLSVFVWQWKVGIFNKVRDMEGTANVFYVFPPSLLYAHGYLCDPQQPGKASLERNTDPD